MIAGSEFRTFFVVSRECAVGGVFYSGFLFRGFGTKCSLAFFVDVDVLSLVLVFGRGGFNGHGAGVTRGRGRTGLLRDGGCDGCRYGCGCGCGCSGRRRKELFRCYFGVDLSISNVDMGQNLDAWFSEPNCCKTAYSVIAALDSYSCFKQ